MPEKVKDYEAFTFFSGQNMKKRVLIETLIVTRPDSSVGRARD